MRKFLALTVLLVLVAPVHAQCGKGRGSCGAGMSMSYSRTTYSMQTYQMQQWVPTQAMPVVVQTVPTVQYAVPVMQARPAFRTPVRNLIHRVRARASYSASAASACST